MRMITEKLSPDYRLSDPDTEIYVGDCRDVLTAQSKSERRITDVQVC